MLLAGRGGDFAELGGHPKVGSAGYGRGLEERPPNQLLIYSKLVVD